MNSPSRLGLRWTMSAWAITLVTVSMFLSALAVSAYELGESEREALTRVRLTLSSGPLSSPILGPATHLATPQALQKVRRALGATFVITEWGRYRAHLKPHGAQMSSAPSPASFTSRPTILKLESKGGSALLSPVRYEIGLSLPSETAEVRSPTRLILRVRSIGIVGQLRSLVVSEWMTTALQVMILVGFALYLLQRSLLNPLGSLTRLARELSGVQSTPAPELKRGAPELLTLQGALLSLHRELRAEQSALASAYSKLQAQERLVTAGFLSARVMHELGNPLASVSGLLEFLRDDPEVNPEQRELLELALKELWRMRDTSQTLLRFTRESAEGEPEIDQRGGATEIDELISWAQFMLRYHEEYHRISLEVTGATEVSLQMSETPLKHALLNLILNAARAQGGVGSLWLHIDVGVEREGQRGAQLTLSDQGSGVERGAHASLDLSTLQCRRGGLGLSIARESVELQGGALWLVSHRAGEGDQSYGDESAMGGVLERSVDYPGARFAIWAPLTS